jgi:hypothetical protein
LRVYLVWRKLQKQRSKNSKKLSVLEKKYERP